MHKRPNHRSVKNDQAAVGGECPLAALCRIEKIYQDIKMVAKHGGFRKGAGRPKGSRNRATIAREARQREALAVARAEDASLMPIDFLLRVLRDPTTPPGRRTAVAKFVARYLKHK
jgi:hypothetical protein